MLMTFTLARYFDFCTSWEDDQAGRTKFFADLTSVSGNAELKWIYDAAKETYFELYRAQQVMQGMPSFRLDGGSEGRGDGISPGKIWIHAGDDLAYDVGGSAQSGARTIWLELDEARYGQTARQRFDDGRRPVARLPRWSTSTPQELERRRVLNRLAMDKVDERVRYLSRLPEAVRDIVDRVNEELGGGPRRRFPWRRAAALRRASQPKRQRHRRRKRKGSYINIALSSFLQASFSKPRFQA
jgi:hypothetical protein